MRRVRVALVLLLGLAPWGTGCGRFSRSSRPRRELSASSGQVANRLLAELHLGRLDRSTSLRSRLGLPGAPPYWPIDTENDLRNRRKLLEQEAEQLRALDLGSQRATLRLYIRAAEDLVQRDLEVLRWGDHEPLLSSSRGLHVAGPQLLRDLPVPRSTDELRIYFERWTTLAPALRRLAQRLEDRLELGTLPPRRIIERARGVIAMLLSGAPFERPVDALPDPMMPSDGILFGDMRARIDGVPYNDDAERRVWMREASRVLLEDVGPAYRALDLTLEKLAPKAPSDLGAWARPRGRDWYASRVGRATDMTLSPSDLHTFGLRQIAPLRDELRLMQEQLGSDYSLSRFLAVLREDERLSLPSDGAGRAALVEDVKRWTRTAQSRLGEMLEPVLELELGVQLCSPPLVPIMAPVRWLAPQLGEARGGTLCVRTSGWDPIPRWIGPAWTAAAGLPGEALRQRHLQANRNLPDLLRYSSAPPLEVGWSLFAARIADRLGLFETPHDQVGRLVLEVWHASLLVADTGIHSQRWSRIQAIDYLFEGTSFPRSVCIGAVERIIEEPGDACAGLAGLRALYDLESQMRTTLGDDYFAPAFHHAVLSAGPIPMNLVAEFVELAIDGA